MRLAIACVLTFALCVIAAPPTPCGTTCDVYPTGNTQCLNNTAGTYACCTKGTDLCNTAGGNCVCGSTGECTSNSAFKECQCNEPTLWAGPYCRTPQCTSPVCQNNGLCVAPNTCDCTGTGYNGTDCTDPICDNGCGNGECIAHNNCDCDDGWTQDSTGVCTIAICLPKGCNEGVGGKCIAPGVCNCTAAIAQGYNGSRCDIPICKNPCQNGGVCSGPDTCNCQGTGYVGATCTNNVNECTADAKTFPCWRNASLNFNPTCTDTIGNWTCTPSVCPTGYIGSVQLFWFNSTFLKSGGCFDASIFTSSSSSSTATSGSASASSSSSTASSGSNGSSASNSASSTSNGSSGNSNGSASNSQSGTASNPNPGTAPTGDESSAHQIVAIASAAFVLAALL